MKIGDNLPPRLRPKKDQARGLKPLKPPRKLGIQPSESRVRYAGTSRPQR